MYAQAVSNAAVTSNYAAVALTERCRIGNHLTAVTSLQRKARGELLFAEGDEAKGVYEVVSGMLRLIKLLPDGRRQITGFLSAGHLVGLAPERVHVYTAEAVTEVTLCRYGRAAFERLIDDVPGFAKRLLAIASDELRASQDQILLLGRKTAAEKIASFLLQMAEQQNADHAREIDLPMTRSDIADYLGVTIETVSRTLTKLKQDGLIAFLTPTRIEIRDCARLEKLAAAGVAQDSKQRHAFRAGD
jgi:CRP/FNR family transcriptional regulator, anaerobic regulatory protein